MKISYDCSSLIEEINADIVEFGENKSAFAIWEEKEIYLPFSNEITKVTVLVNYLLDADEMPNEKELPPGEIAIKSTLKEIQQVLIEQNKIV